MEIRTGKGEEKGGLRNYKGGREYGCKRSEVEDERVKGEKVRKEGE